MTKKAFSIFIYDYQNISYVLGFISFWRIGFVQNALQTSPAKTLLWPFSSVF